jgi:hypothetical protein
MCLNTRHEAIVAELLLFVIQRLCDAVAIGDTNIAWIELQALFWYKMRSGLADLSMGSAGKETQEVQR